MARTSTKLAQLPYKIMDRFPTLTEFVALIEAVGWSRYTNVEALPAALEGSLFAVVAIHKKQVIGTGRLVGDGARSIYVQDMMVLPAFQRRGVGTAIIDRLMAYINMNAPRKTYIHLFTDKKTSAFYQRYGFQGSEKSFYGMSVKKFDKSLQREDE